MYQILDGKATALHIKEQLANEVRHYTAQGLRAPHLAAILVGDDGASQTYVANKEKSAHEVGYTSSVSRYAAETTEDESMKTIEILNNDDDVDGFIGQLPVPDHI
ncbi:MAG: bifunctional 5,10-methylene-tetrahydrofolate dehydrogenase/5,10-methylene-tetrahydrofolate cyclohydrolase, partial [Bacteroidales bacterium]|nr:bifunctional 5,10-methylene-tetrahydrofolate dehydrogenase/5,10-methylene-tetrahydrofolate cyclohydrolase [Candidatus Colimorpha onthohippi]